MRVQDKTAGITEDDLLAVAAVFDIKKPGRIIDRARDAVADWERFAAETRVPARTVADVRAALDERSVSLAG